MGEHLLRTFFSRRVQPLRQRVTQMWLYPRPSCPDHPFFEELGNAENNTRIYKVLAYGVGLNPVAGPTPLREGIDSTRVCPLAFAFGNLIHSLRSCPFVGCRVCSQHATGGQLI
jgi:hypothetical protein